MIFAKYLITGVTWRDRLKLMFKKTHTVKSEDGTVFYKKVNGIVYVMGIDLAKEGDDGTKMVQTQRSR